MQTTVPERAARPDDPDQLAVLVKSSAVARAHFGAMVVTAKPMLKPAEAAEALRCDLRTIARLFEARELRGLEFSATGTGARMTRRIERWSVCSLLIRKANYTVEDHLVCVVKFLNALTEPERAIVLASVKWTEATGSGGNLS